QLGGHRGALALGRVAVGDGCREERVGGAHLGSERSTAAHAQGVRDEAKNQGGAFRNGVHLLTLSARAALRLSASTEGRSYPVLSRARPRTRRCDGSQAAAPPTRRLTIPVPLRPGARDSRSIIWRPSPPARPYADRMTLHCSEDEFVAVAEAERDALPAWIKERVAAANVA